MTRNLLVLGTWGSHSLRNRVLSMGLSEHGVNTKSLPLPGRFLTRARTLLNLPETLVDWSDLLFLPKVAQPNAPVAAWVARNARRSLVADFFASLHLSEIVDRQNASSLSWKSLRYYALDRILSAGPDYFITDTKTHRDLLAERYGLPADRATVIPVGAEPCSCAPPRHRDTSDPLRVLFIGHYIPLHGVKVILKAAQILGANSNFQFTMIGNGQERPEAEQFIARHRLMNVKMLDPVPYDDLAPHLDRTDVVLGIFDDGPKARAVVPKKAYLALAAGRCLVTGDTPAAREWLRPDQDAMLVPPSSPFVLAEALTALRSNPTLANELARAGHELYKREFTPYRIAARFLDLPGWRKQGQNSNNGHRSGSGDE